MSWRIDTSEWIAGSMVIGEVGLGVLGSSIPSSSIMANDVTLPAQANDEFRALVLTVPAGGTIFFREDGTFTPSGYAPGTYNGTYRGYRNGVVYAPNPASYSFVVSDARLGGFEMGGGAKNTYRKTVLQKRLEQRAEQFKSEPPAPAEDGLREIERQGAKLLLAKKGEQSLGPLLKKWLALKPKLARGTDPKAAFVARVKGAVAEMMEKDDSLMELM